MAEKHKLPIDIQSKQLLEALVDRCIVPHKWLEQLKQIRDAIASLYSELPLASEALSEFCAKKSSYEELNYFDCKMILKYLEQSSGGATKNFFGQYTSPVIKRWSALIRQYEKNNIFAAETARIIAQNTAFEIPFLKKSIQQNEKQIADNNRKLVDLSRRIVEYKRKLEASCADLDIKHLNQGVNFREELRRLPLELPSNLDSVAMAICSEDIFDAFEYHQALQIYLHDCEVPVAAPVADNSKTSAVKKTKKARKKGKNQCEAAGELETSTNEPFELIVVSPNFFGAIAELRSAGDALMETQSTLDFEAEAAEINWDISIDESGTADAGEIDWSIESVASARLGATVDDAPVEIEWDITCSNVVDPVSETDAFDGNEVVHEIATTEKPSRVKLLQDTEFRTRVLNDLLELRAFLSQRLIELSGGDSVAFANQFQGCSPRLEQQSTAKIEELLAAVNKAVSLLTSKRLQQLVLLQTSERYLNRHVAHFEMLTKHMDKCHREILNLEDKNVGLIDATKNVQSQIDILVVSTKKLKKDLEGALPPLFKGYKVNIVGDVNSL